MLQLFSVCVQKLRPPSYNQSLRALVSQVSRQASSLSMHTAPESPSLMRRLASLLSVSSQPPRGRLGSLSSADRPAASAPSHWVLGEEGVSLPSYSRTISGPYTSSRPKITKFTFDNSQ